MKIPNASDKTMKLPPSDQATNLSRRDYPQKPKVSAAPPWDKGMCFSEILKGFYKYHPRHLLYLLGAPSCLLRDSLCNCIQDRYTKEHQEYTKRHQGSYAFSGFLLLILLAALGCSDKPLLAGADNAATRKTATLRQQIEEIQGVAGAPDVPVLRLAKGSIGEELSITGELTPINSVVVKPLLDGRITFLKPIKVGDMVKKDEPIAKIDDRDIEDEIASQEKTISLSGEKLKLDEQNLEQSRKDLEFDRQLTKEGYLNEHEFEKSEMTLKQSQIALSQSKISLDIEQNRLKKALRQREKVPITAPIGGMVVLASHLTSSEDKTNSLLNEDILSLEGTLVGTGTPIFGIVSQDGYLAQCSANGRDKAKIHEGQPAAVTVITHRPITVKGKVSKISLLQDAKTHAYKIWIALDEMDKSFTSGLFVRAGIQLARREETLVVKKEYVKERNNRQFVQIVQGTTVKDRWITTGIAQDDKIEIESGVKAGDMLLASKDVFAAEQAVHPVELADEDENSEKVLKITPDEDALPIVFKKQQEPGQPTLALMQNEETTPTRARLHVKMSGPVKFEQFSVTFNGKGPLPTPLKVLHEGDVQSATYDVPLNQLARGKNAAAFRLNENRYSINRDITISTVELWLDRP